MIVYELRLCATDEMCLGYDSMQKFPALPCSYCRAELLLITCMAYVAQKRRGPIRGHDFIAIVFME
jgi:hypothetical protein